MSAPSLIIRAMVSKRAGSRQHAGAFPPGLSRRAVRTLARLGARSLDDLARLSESDVAGLRGIDPKTLAMLRSELTLRGLAFSVSRRFKRVPRIPPGSESPGCCPWCGHDPALRFFDLLPLENSRHDVDCRTCGRPCVYSSGLRVLAVLVGLVVSLAFGLVAGGLIGLWPALFVGFVVYGVVSVGIIRARLRLARRGDWIHW